MNFMTSSHQILTRQSVSFAALQNICSLACREINHSSLNKKVGLIACACIGAYFISKNLNNLKNFAVVVISSILVPICDYFHDSKQTPVSIRQLDYSDDRTVQNMNATIFINLLGNDPFNNPQNIENAKTYAQFILTQLLNETKYHHPYHSAPILDPCLQDDNLAKWIEDVETALTVFIEKGQFNSERQVDYIKTFDKLMGKIAIIKEPNQ